MKLLEKARSFFTRGPKAKFYKDIILERVEWWYSWTHSYPHLFFARMRIFSNGTADVRFQDEPKTFGFVDAQSAANFVAEDEFSRLSGLDDEDREFLGIPDDVVIESPNWQDPEDLDFEYIGEY